MRATPPGPEPDEVPEVAAGGRRGISIVWLIPLVALAVGGWLAYTTLSEKGPTITITFKTAEGLEAGKTRVKYKDVEVGLVDTVELSEDLGGVIVTADMEKAAESHLGPNTRFWVVRPRIGATGVSGLGTLVSGAYIQIDPHEGELTTEFTGLEEPPRVLSDEPGRRYILLAEEGGSVSAGSPVYFRGIQVGEVLGRELAEDDRNVRFHVFIHAPHDQLVQNHSRFWNASGFRMSLDADGFDVRTASLESLLAGGIEFDTPRSAQPMAQAAADTVFTLYPDFTSVTESALTEGYPFIAHFEGSVRGLRRGAPVEFRGLRMGTVREVSVEVDPATLEIRIPVVFDIEPQRIARVGERVAGGERGEMPPNDFIDLMVQRGLRAQLKSGNILTGELLIELDFHPDAAPAELIFGDVYPEIPTVPSTLDALTASVSGTLQKLAALPLDDLVADLRQTIQNADALLTSADSREVVAGLAQSVQELRAVLATLRQRTGPVLDQAEATLATAEGMIGDDSELRYDVDALLRELIGAARSIRLFADYLERHPEALIQGKGRQ